MCTGLGGCWLAWTRAPRSLVALFRVGRAVCKAPPKATVFWAAKGEMTSMAMVASACLLKEKLEGRRCAFADNLVSGPPAALGKYVIVDVKVKGIDLKIVDLGPRFGHRQQLGCNASMPYYRQAVWRWTEHRHRQGRYGFTQVVWAVPTLL